jgi:arylsulfatase A-like enzyme
MNATPFLLVLVIIGFGSRSVQRFFSGMRMMKTSLGSIVLILLISLVTSLSGSKILVSAPAAEEPAVKPNILFIYLDDYGWRDLSYMGSDYYETPNIDNLARGGMIFTNAYACAANCAPSRACLLSGQYTPRHEIYNVGTRPRGKSEYRKLKHIPGTDTLDPGITTWAECLQKAGYTTATMGKWHLSNDPLPYGFDRNVGGTHSGSPPSGYFPPHRVPGLEEAPEGEYLTDRLHEEAIRFITKNRDRRWCLYLTHFAVHTPLQAKESLIEKYENKPDGQLHDHAIMAAMIESVDQGVGKLVATLEKLKLRDETVVIFYSDNGGYGPATSMEPLKGYKGTYYEGGIRVPFFVHWPKVVKEGTRCEVPITGVDIFPTLLEIGNAEKPDQPLDGKSLLTLFRGETDWEREAIYWHFPAYLQSYRNRTDQQRDPLFRSRPCGIIRSGKWKLHEYFEDGGLELYDLENDIGEQNNLAETMPEKARLLHEKLKRWRREIGAPVPREQNPEYDAQAEAEAIEELR